VSINYVRQLLNESEDYELLGLHKSSSTIATVKCKMGEENVHLDSDTPSETFQCLLPMIH